MFEDNKTARQLKIDKTRKFVVVRLKSKETCGFKTCKVGDILELSEDDNTICPFFNNLTNGTKNIVFPWRYLKYLK